MNFNCVICSDLFTPNADIYSTPCGHIFHYHCLAHWMEKSRTCPQCRQRITDKSLVKLFINISNSICEIEDVTTLHHQIDNLQFQLRMDKKNFENLTSKYNEMSDQNLHLRNYVKDLEDGGKKHESTIGVLKDKIKYLKQKSLLTDKLKEEVDRLTTQVKNLENVSLVVSAPRKQVEDIIRNETNIESLALLTATLKKTLVETENKKNQIQFDLKKVKNEMSKYKRTALEYQSKEESMKQQLESMKLNHEKEVAFLKKKFTDLEKKISSGGMLSDSVNNSLARVIAESPVNFNRTPVNPVKRPNSENVPKLEKKTSQPVPNSNKGTINSQAVRTNRPTSSLALGVLGNQRTRMLVTKSDENKYSIFKSKLPTHPLPSQSNMKTDICYNGLGGSSKEDIFPTGTATSTGVKRPKVTKSYSAKYKKVSAEAGKPNRKVTEFF